MNDSPFTFYELNDKQIIMRKSTLCRLLSTHDTRLSSDRLLRFKSKEEKFASRSEQKARSISENKKIIFGDWCILKDMNSFKMRILRALNFKKKKVSPQGRIIYANYTPYSVNVPDKLKIELNDEGKHEKPKITVVCFAGVTYILDKKTNFLKEIPSALLYFFHDIKNYVCTLPSPLMVNGILKYEDSIAADIFERRYF